MNTLGALKNIGLSEKEAKVYIALLQTGRTSAYVVALRSDLKKPTTYVVLDDLVEKGFVTKIPRAKKKLYEARPPEEVFAVAEEKFNLAKDALPELASITKKQSGKTQTLYFEGLAGIEQALNYRKKEMKGGEFVGFYATLDETQKSVKPIIDNYLESLKKDRITIRGIAPDDKSLEAYRKTDEQAGRNMKTVPTKEYSSNVSIDVGDTFVRIVSFNDSQATIVESQDTARAVREIFEMVWKNK